MEIKYDKKYLQELYENSQCSEKKYRFQPEVVSKYQKRIDTLLAATRKEDLFVFRSLNFEALAGTSQFSIRIDLKYRLVFELSESDGEPPIITVCTIIDITNHYK